MGDIDDTVIDWRYKGFPPQAEGTTVSAFVASRPSLFDAGFSWPVMTLRESALASNIDVLARWCSSSGISFAPHGKTTMTPALFKRQLAAGAWAMTAATPWQVRAYRAFGVRRVLLANELVDTAFVSWLAEQPDDFEFYCYVDSISGVDILGAANQNAARRLRVLVEVGVPGGRTGVRDDDQALAVARAVAKWNSLSLVGIAGYEGPLGHGRDAETVNAVRAYVTHLGDVLRMLDRESLFDPDATEFVFSCGGSGQVDVVTEALRRPLDCSRPVRAVLRSGSYVTHDNGLYAKTSALAGELTPAIEVWCQVWSRPEPTLALLGAGRRDVPFDSGLPVPLWRRSRNATLESLAAKVVELNDQHAFLRLSADASLDVGDLVCLGISHPCTAHDKWQLLPVLDDDRRVIDCVHSYF
jgi:D-serine deaminase-like pyridoxal phosphate-dependent protein